MNEVLPVHLVHQDLADFLVLLDHRDREENLVHLEMMGGMEKMDSEDNLDNLALLERMELLV